LLVSGLAVFAAEQQRRRRFLSTPWQALRPDRAPRRYSEQEQQEKAKLEASQQESPGRPSWKRTFGAGAEPADADNSSD
jgi:hypothetical protein